MAKLTEAQLGRRDVVDAIRTATGLFSRIALRRLRNDIESEILSQYDARLAAGKPFKLDMKSLVGNIAERYPDD